MILVGFTVPDGERFEIPDTGHMAAIGQTQLSGKTTLLEAIAFRGRLKAIAFITKRGEGSFLTAHAIQPYFSEPTSDAEKPLWQWVKSILEASQQRRLNFEEAWIIRACEEPKQAKSLADVHANIKSLLAGEGEFVEKGRGKRKKKEWRWHRKPVTGMNASIYTSLKAYFDIVMPQLARLPYTKRLELKTGLNVMDLREYATETQALVIRSVMEWIYLHETGCRVIVPEAQDFVPQGRNSPVKMACETIVRKGAADRNFIWFDSQDMAAVDKVMLRACSIVFVGVQTEMHEVDRSMASMFTPTLRAEDIASLKIGFFYVRTPEVRGSKVYVEPAWMDSEPHAQAIARGELPVESARQMLRAFESSLKKNPRVPAPPQLLQVQIQTREDETDEENSASRSDREPVSPGSPDRPALDPGRAPGAGSENHAQGDDAMWEEKYKELETEHKALIGVHDAMAARMKVVENALKKAGIHVDVPTNFHEPSPSALDSLIKLGPKNPTAEAVPSGNGHGLRFTVPDLEYIYKYIRTRAADDKAVPNILEVLARRSEVHVKVIPHTISIAGEKMDGQLARLVYEGFFEKPRDRGAVGDELRRRGVLRQNANLKILSPYLAKLTEWGFLRNEPDGFHAVPGMKVHIEK